jgi:hypothetical protein
MPCPPFDVVCTWMKPVVAGHPSNRFKHEFHPAMVQSLHHSIEMFPSDETDVEGTWGIHFDGFPVSSRTERRPRISNFEELGMSHLTDFFPDFASGRI